MKDLNLIVISTCLALGCSGRTAEQRGKTEFASEAKNQLV